jgi:hypothetical protein
MKVIEVITIKSINQLIETLKKLENDNVSESFIKKVYRDLQEKQTQPVEIVSSCGDLITIDTKLGTLISSFNKDDDFFDNKFGGKAQVDEKKPSPREACKTFIIARIEQFKKKDLNDLADLTDASINNLSLEELNTKLENLKIKLKNLKNTYDGAPPNIIRDITSEYDNKITKIKARIVEIENTMKKNEKVENEKVENEKDAKKSVICASNPDRVGCLSDTFPGKKSTSLFTKTLKRFTS